MSLLKKIFDRFCISCKKEEIIEEKCEKGSFKVDGEKLNYELGQLAILNSSKYEDEVTKAICLYIFYNNLRHNGYEVWIEGRKRDESGKLYVHKISFEL